MLDDVSADARLVIHDMGVDISRSPKALEQYQVSHRRGDTMIPRIPYPEPLAREMAHFLRCIRDGSEPLSGGQHAVSVVRTIQRIQCELRGG